MRICLIVESLSDFGGLEEIMTELAVALRQRGHQISVVSTVWVQPNSQYKRTLKENGISLVQWPFMPLVRALAWAWVVVPTLLRNRSWSQAIEAKRNWEYEVCENAGWMYETSKYNTPCFRLLLACWCRIWRPDLIHIHSFVHELNLMHIVEWTNSRGIPTVFEEHQTPDPTGPRWDDFRSHINSATMVGAVSQKAKQVMRDGLGVERPITVLPPIVADPGTCERGANEQETRRDSGPIITTIARYIPEKGLPYLFEAVADLRKTHPTLQFRLFGDGPSPEYTMEVSASAQRFGLDPDRDFAGTYLRSDLGNIMKETDIFVLASLTEGLPLTVVEAMAFGRPIVATAVGGIPDVLEDGVNALLCPPANPASLAAALRRLLDSPDECARLGRAARQSFEQGVFHPDEACRRYVSMYEHTLHIAHEASCN
jgi:glycosyltransferase involved in cell wall biosynthesis